ncbi:glycosyltransferase [Acidithiobacillus montserratensis]|uniref:Glycosyltransferase n=1 Tax=Acidithiobacillus montserratensis TaxID=2729135 RepID=A0ACD5HCQ3_9PROT|nr:glycosyltransferase [Acidithiobacillus montserratensis]MBU2748435.1 glycosyltransferase [Acidithiobacillus montserratensis]
MLETQTEKDLNKNVAATLPTRKCATLINTNAATKENSEANNQNAKKVYIPVYSKFLIAQFGAILWVLFSIWVALPWMDSLAKSFGWVLTIFAIGGIAIVPGYISGIIIFSILLDRRPPISTPDELPAVSILIAAYNEENAIEDTLKSILNQFYSGIIEIIVIDDGSTDKTIDIVETVTDPRIKIIQQKKNQGKASALNAGLAAASHGLIITVDADTFLYKDALKYIVGRYLGDPEGTAAVAGAIAVRNSRKSWITRIQEWDYFHGIAVVKRVQSLYQGTLVAQGAFSLYKRDLVMEMGGWAPCVGEDIVLSWGLLKQGYRIGYAENAIVFTNVPETYKQLFQQRRRWARGMFEAIRAHPGIFLKRRITLQFVFINMLFPWLDISYLLFFIPGIIAACFGFFLLAGPITLLLLPLAAINNVVIFSVQSTMFKERGIHIRKNLRGMFLYVFLSQLLMSPASLAGYGSELLSLRKKWGTK